MRPMQAKIVTGGGRIKSITPQFGKVTIATDRGTSEFDNAWVTPGLVDAHGHFLGLGQRLNGLNLAASKSEEEAVEIIEQHHHLRSWIVGAGWNEEVWGAPMPTKSSLDARFPTTPVFVTRIDGHAAWVNSKALELAGIGNNATYKGNGEIQLDASGIPTGILIDEAMELVRKFIPIESNDEKLHHYKTAGALLSKLGITEIHDMDVHPSNLDVIRTLAESGTLPVRVQSFVSGGNDEWNQARLLPAGGEFLRVYSIKLYADGALGSRGAALLSPYSDASNTSGILFDVHTMRNRAQLAVEQGWNVAIHAIGDRGVREVLNVYEYLRRERIADEYTLLRCEHSQIVHPDDVPRFTQNNVIPSVQPIHCTSDAMMAEKRLGARCEYAYPWRTLRNAGCYLAAGSDFPIESANPLEGIHAFCERIPNGGNSTWQPQETITREEALLAYTTWAHEAADVSYRRGQLKEKYDADFVVWDRDILSCTSEELLQANVLATYSGGVIRYESEKA